MTESAFAKVAVIGLGLMGGSLALALTRTGYDVAGWDADFDSITEAWNLGAIKKIPVSLAEVVAETEVVFVATPVSAIPRVIAECLPLTKTGTIFSDLGSIKQTIVNQVKEFLPDSHYFVPGHPMTGSEQNGIAAADPFLFQNAAYILIKTEFTPPSVLQTVYDIVKTTGAHLLTLQAEEHDRIVGMVSHLPHLIAAVLAKTAGSAEEIYPGTLRLAAGGFRDTTRIATGSPRLWEGIIFGNKPMVLEAIRAFEQQLAKLREIVSSGATTDLISFLAAARDVRLQIPARNKGFLTLLYEMVVTIEDKPGAINEVIQYLAYEGINIKDIEILRVREGDGGTLRLALEEDSALERGIQILTAKGFKVKRR